MILLNHFITAILLSLFISDTPYYSVANIEWVDVGGTEGIIVHDYADPNQPIKLLDANLDQKIGTLRSGRGPGEVSQADDIDNFFYSSFMDSFLVIWDRDRFRGMIYDENLNYVSDIKGLDKFTLYRFLVINDSHGIGIRRTAGEAPFILFDLNKTENGTFIASKVNELQTPESLKPMVENRLLRQGRTIQLEEITLTGFLYSSTLLAINEHGISWKTAQPEDYSLPIYEGVEQPDAYTRIFKAPDVADYPMGVLDLAGNDDYFFILYSGRKGPDPPDGWFRRLFSQITFDPDELLHGKRLFLYDHEGQFINEFSIPMEARTLAVSKDRIWLGSEAGRYPEIQGYRIEEILGE